MALEPPAVVETGFADCFSADGEELREEKGLERVSSKPARSGPDLVHSQSKDQGGRGGGGVGFWVQGGLIHFLQGSCSEPQALPSPVAILGKP